jgi:hypothetical protein
MTPEEYHIYKIIGTIHIWMIRTSMHNPVFQIIHELYDR